MQRISSYEKFTHNGETLFFLAEMQKSSNSTNDRIPPSSSWVVVCVDRTRERVNLVFWRPDCKGYTSDLVQAGQYLEHEAKEICDSGHHVRYRLSTLQQSSAARTVVDRDSSSFFEDAKQAARILRARIKSYDS